MPSANIVLKEHPWVYHRKDLRTHYTHSKAAPFRSLFYGIYLGYQRVGVIGVSSTHRPMLSVIKEVYGVDEMTREIMLRYGNEIVTNDILRLHVSEANLATRVLSQFVKVLYRDFHKKYDVWLRGIISLTYGVNESGVERTGVSYKAANWKYLGLSKGASKVWSNGRYTYKRVKPKHVWLWVYRQKHERKPPPPDLDLALSNALDSLDSSSESPVTEVSG